MTLHTLQYSRWRYPLFYDGLERSKKLNEEKVSQPPKNEKIQQLCLLFINMPRRSRKQTVQVNMDSDEEFTISSEEEEDFEDERLHFEDRIDPAVDTNEWVISPQPAHFFTCKGYYSK